MAEAAEKRGATRCTILFDKELYKKTKNRANDNDFKVYEWLNNLMAKDLGLKPLYLSKVEKDRGKKPTEGLAHPTTKIDRM